jgi:hypothetical protein
MQSGHHSDAWRAGAGHEGGLLPLKRRNNRSAAKAVRKSQNWHFLRQDKLSPNDGNFPTIKNLVLSLKNNHPELIMPRGGNRSI